MEQAGPKLLSKKLGFKNFFLIEYVGFNLVGIDFDSGQRVLRRPWIPIITGVSTLLIMVGSSHYSATHIYDLDVVTDAMAPFVQCVLAIWKLAIILSKRKEMMDLLRRIWDITDQATEIDLKEIVKENKAHWRLSFIYCLNVVVAVSSAVLMPLCVGVFSYIAGDGFVYKTPMTATYPLDIHEPFYYIVCFIINLLVIYIVACTVIAVDSLYSWCVHNIVGQFKILQNKIEALKTSHQHEASGSKHCRTDDYIRKSIIHCINYHQQTIALADQLNNAFRPIVFVEFTLNSTQLCLIGYQIGRGINLSAMPFLFSFMMTILVQLLLYSYGGQHLENESERVALFIYKNVEWDFWSIRERKLLLFSMLRAQRPLKMTAIFFDVNMRIFLWVIQTSASYVALLWSVGRN